MTNIRIFPTQPQPNETYSFTAFFKSDAKFAKDGICTMRVEIPWENRETVLKLLEHCDWPMEVTIKPMERDYDF